MFKRVVTVLLNPALDVTADCERFHLGEENRVDKERFDVGGKAINVSRALKSGGIDSTAIILAGEDNLTGYIEKLKEERIDGIFVREKGRIRENISIRLPDGSITRLMRTGFTATKKGFDAVKREVAASCSPGCLCVFSGSLPWGFDEDWLEALCAAAQAAGARIVLDTRKLSLARMLKIKPFLIKPNLEEFELLIGKDGLTFLELNTELSVLREKGLDNILLSLGADGMLYAGEEGHWVAKVPTVKPLSAVGAGDSSLAGFLAALLSGEPPESRLRRAAAFGTAACLTEGTKPPKREQIEELYQQICLSAL